MNFFEQQERARKHTRHMLMLFIVAVAAIVFAVDLVLVIAMNSGGGRHSTAHVTMSIFSPGALFLSTAITLGVIGLASAYKISTLRSGGSAVALQLGATLVPADTSDFAYRRLRNVVEEIAIASGVPVPEIFVMEDEPGINAFAAGYTTADAAVTVTRGAMDKLTREELQGVIAHEFSHVLNGDMRLNIRLMGVVFGILALFIVGQKIAQGGFWFSSSDDRRNNGGIVAFGFALMAIGGIGLFFGRLIKAGISRQREYLADASAVQFTRQTVGISGALKKIGGLAEGSKLGVSDKEEVAHMLFGDGIGYSAMFATHPPLPKRIRAIEPNFNESEFAVIAAAWSEPVAASDMNDSNVSISGLAPVGAASMVMRAAQAVIVADKAAPLPAANAQLSVSPQMVVAQVSAPGKDDYQTAGTLNNAIPDRMRSLAYTLDRAMPLIYSLVLEQAPEIHTRQLALIERYYDTAMRQKVEELLPEVAALHPMQRLPLAALAFPALRKQPRPALQTFVLVLNQLIQADGQTSLEEYCLAKLVTVQVIEALDPSRSASIGRNKLPDCAAQVTDLFSIVARYGNDDEPAARHAYLQGMREVLPDSTAPYAPPKEWTMAMDGALRALDLLAPAGKELLLRGLTAAISADGKVSVSEAELLRTICASLHCPLPPQLDQVA